MHSKGNCQQNEKYFTIDWEKIFANDITDKELIYKYIQTTQTIQHQRNKVFKNGKKNEQTFFQI